MVQIGNNAAYLELNSNNQAQKRHSGQLFKICWAMEISGACKIDHLITGKQYGLQMLTGHCYNKKGERVVPCLLIYLSSGPWKALSNLSPLKTCFPEPLYLYPQT